MSNADAWHLLLMAKKRFSAEKSFRWIQKKSMDTRKSMKEIVEAVIISQDIKNINLTYV